MRWWQGLRERFWFLPAVLCLAAVVLAEALVTLDRGGPPSLGPLSALVYRVGASGSRDLLAAIAGSVLTAAATTFSITMAVLALTSSSYGPRLVRNFMTDRGNQLVLGTFLASFLYALLVLRSIRSGDSTIDSSAFVPQLAVNVAVLLAVLDIAVLVYFIHHISDSIQVSTLARRVRDELYTTADRLYPDGTSDDGHRSTALPERLRADGVGVTAERDGYLLGLETGRLVRLARDADLVVVVQPTPGDHVLRGDCLAVLWPPGDAANGAVAKVRRAILVGEARTPHQDIAFATQQLVEMAVRALSSGINDPFTAVNALDDLTGALATMAARGGPVSHHDDDAGTPRLWAPATGLDQLLDTVFAHMCTYAVSAPAVLHRAVDLAATVGEAACDHAVRLELERQVARLLRAQQESGRPSDEVGLLEAHAARVRHLLLNPVEGGAQQA